MLAIEELTPSTCHWPIAEVALREYLFCGEAIDPSPSPTMRCYCRRHTAIAYTPVRAPSRPIDHQAAPSISARQSLWL
jgi:hypothetical protein